MTPARRTMPAAIGVLLASALAGCAATPDSDDEQPDPSVEETYVYLETLNPDTVLSVRFDEPLRYDVVNVRFVYMDVKSGRYLVEMERECRYLKSNQIFTDMADRRSMRGRIRARIDTIRGCRIDKIYKLPDVEETHGPDRGLIEDAANPEQAPHTTQESS